MAKQKPNYHLAVSRELLILGPDLSRPRLRVEYEKVRDFCSGFSFKSETSYGKKVVEKVEGSFRINGKQYGLTIKIPKNYPYEIPKVYPKGWNPSGAPHRYNGGDLCLMHPDQWNEVYSIAFVIKKAQYWVHKYLEWDRTGSWPGRSQD